MRIQLVDRNEGMCEAWKREFEDCDDVDIHCGDFFDLETDCVVSPANSFGFMDGSLDYVISSKLGWHIQKNLQNHIKNIMGGEVLIGQSVLVPTERDDIKYVISAPTMRVPMVLDGDKVSNVYQATKAVFQLLKTHELSLGGFTDGILEPIDKVTMSGMGTGVGQVPYDTCARLMKKAYDDFWLEGYEFPKTWHEAQKNHQSLYSKKN